MHPTLLALLVASSAIFGGCTIARPAPGADQVRLSTNAADVATCTVAGNLQVPKDAQGRVDGASAQTQFRNLTVGLGGNLALVTEGYVSIPVAGIAYRCP
jgi:hypothetical protein